MDVRGVAVGARLVSRPAWLLTREQLAGDRSVRLSYLLSDDSRPVVTIPFTEHTPENVTRIGEALASGRRFERRRRRAR